MRRRLSYWLLAALLVIGQAALLAHQSDVAAHSLGDQCTVCLLAHGLDHAVPGKFVLHLDKPDVAQLAVAPAATRAAPAAVYYPVRAPPFSHTP